MATTQPIKKAPTTKQAAKGSQKSPGSKVLGAYDVLPREEDFVRAVAAARTTVSELHDYHLLETPIVESESLAMKGYAKCTDGAFPWILKQKSGDGIAVGLSSEFGAVRAYCDEHLAHYASPLKIHCAAQVFTTSGPKLLPTQAHEVSFHVIGDSDPIYDCQSIIAGLDFIKALKIKDTVLKVSTYGCRGCRGVFKEKTKTYYAGKRSKLCASCVKGLEHQAPYACESGKSDCTAIHEEAPLILDSLCHSCNNHFKTVLELLEDNGVAYEPDPRLSRTVPYGNRTVFEIRGASGKTLAVGGRYDYLAEMLFNRSVAAVGVSIKIPEIAVAVREQKISFREKRRPRVFFVAVGDQAKRASLRPINHLRTHGIPVVESLGKKSLKAQLKVAEKCEATIALIFGQREVFEGSIILRDLRSSAQETIVLDRLVDEVKRRLKA